MTIPEAGTTLPSVEQRSAREGRSAASASSDDAHRQLAWQREMERAQLAHWFKGKPHAQGRDRNNNSTQDQSFERRHSLASAKTVHGAVATPSAGSPLVLSQASPAWPRPGIQAPLAPFVASVQPDGIAPRSLSHGSARDPASTSTVESTPHPRPLLPSATGARLASLEHPTASNTSPAPQANEPPESQTWHAAFEIPSSQAPVRIHEESMPSGQALWIAMRADDQTLTALLPQLVLDLQRAQALQGRQLHQVVCNGELVWRSGDFFPRGASRNDFPHLPASKEIPWPSTQ